jgi:hypothetical protein
MSIERWEFLIGRAACNPARHRALRMLTHGGASSHRGSRCPSLRNPHSGPSPVCTRRVPERLHYRVDRVRMGTDDRLEQRSLEELSVRSYRHSERHIAKSAQPPAWRAQLNSPGLGPSSRHGAAGARAAGSRAANATGASPTARKRGAQAARCGRSWPAVAGRTAGRLLPWRAGASCR